MKSSSILLLVWWAILGRPAWGQVEISAEPHHHLTLENRYVRVFQVEVPPHQATLSHWHRHDYVFVTLGAAEVENDVVGRSPTMLKLADGETRFTRGGFAHLAKNPTDSRFRNVTIELLKSNHAGNNSTPYDQERGLEILEGGTSEALFVKDGVRIVDIELNEGATTPQPPKRGPWLLVALNAVKLRTTPSGRRGIRMEMQAGDIRWLPVVYSLRNLGREKARLIVLEFPL